MRVAASKQLDTDKKEGVLATPPYLPRSRPGGREEMIRQPFKRRCAVCNRVNGLCGSDDQLRSHLLIGSPKRLYGLPTDLQQVSPQLDRNVFVEVHTSLQEWCLTGDRNSRVHKNHRVLRPTLFIPIKPLGLPSLRVLDPALNSHRTASTCVPF